MPSATDIIMSTASPARRSRRPRPSAPRIPIFTPARGRTSALPFTTAISSRDRSPHQVLPARFIRTGPRWRRSKKQHQEPRRSTDMTTRRLGLIMNGVTGRMGLNQHLIRSIIAIREQGGVRLSNGDRVMPDPILIGRNAEKVERLAKQFRIERWSTDLDKALADKNDTVFFDAATTQARPGLLAKAIEAGKHIYCEKPIATTFEEALGAVRLANSRGIKHGTVQDKLFLPGLKKLAFLRDSGFFGRILSVRGEFGYWVFEGGWQEAQRPSWNYR